MRTTSRVNNLKWGDDKSAKDLALLKQLSQMGANVFRSKKTIWASPNAQAVEHRRRAEYKKKMPRHSFL